MRFGSVCSGIEAASVAWHPLGWTAAWLAEIEKFPSEVLAHHYPDVPNLGDMTKLKRMILNGEIEAPEVLVGGCPCQAFSVAGLRQSLEDDRGQLSLTFIHTLDSIDLVRRNRGELPAIAVWENVPGVLSTKDNAFGCFLAGLVGEECALVPAGKRWSDAGFVSGPERSAAWRILDAQYFGLAQRRRRVFVVASARDGFNPAKVLFESEGVRRDTPPSREKGEEVARNAGDGVESCFGIDEECNVTQQGSEPLLRGGQGGTHQAVCFTPSSHGDYRRGMGTLRSNGGDLGEGSEGIICMAHGQAGAEIVRDGEPSLTCNHEAPIVTQYGSLAGSLTARHDSSPCADRGMNVVAFKPGQSAEARSIGAQEEIACTLEAGGGGNNKQAVAFAIQEDRGASTQKTYTGTVLRELREEVGEKTFAEWGLGILNTLQQAQILQSDLHGTDIRLPPFSRRWVVHCALSRPQDCGEGFVQSVRESQREGCASFRWQPSEQRSIELGTYMSELSQPGAQAERFLCDLRQASEGSRLLFKALSTVQDARRPTNAQTKSAYPTMQVRRLTPECCEFLQGFPRGYTNIKPNCPDGPRYKALGNSMAVPVMRWIGARIQKEALK